MSFQSAGTARSSAPTAAPAVGTAAVGANSSAAGGSGATLKPPKPSSGGGSGGSSSSNTASSSNSSSNPNGGRKKAGGGGRAGAHKQQQSQPKLMFVNYQDPTIDYKKEENRKVIAKYAMLNRKKEKIIPPKPPESQRSPPLPPPRIHRAAVADSTDDGRHNARCVRAPSADSDQASANSPASIADSSFTGFSTSPEEVPTYGAVVSPGDYPWLPSTSSSSAAAANSSSSPPSTSPPHSTYDAIGSSPYFPLPASATGSFDFATPPASGQQMQVAWSDTSYSPRIDDTFGTDFSSITDFSDPESVASTVADDQLALSSLTGHNGAEMPVDNFDIFTFPGSFSVPDPFNSFAMPLDSQTHYLLKTYLHADRLSPAMVKTNPQIVHRVRNQRSSMWLPLVQKSAAAMSALTAYVISTFEGAEATNSAFDGRLGTALKEVQKHLNDSEQSLDDATTFAVVMLMMVAQHQGDMRAYNWHATGLSKILDMRQKAFARNEQRATNTFKRGLPTFDVDSAEQTEGKCLHCRDASIRQAISNLASQPRDSTHSTGDGFYRLIEQGVVSQDASKFFEQVFTWCKVADQAKLDRVAAAAAAQHAWIDGSDLSFKEPFEMATTSAVRLTLYLNAWLDWNHSCSAVRLFVRAVTVALQSCNMPVYMQRCPDALVWLCLAVGPFAEGQERAWLLELLRQVAVGYKSSDFSMVRNQLLVQFLWNDSLTHAAERFWDAARIGQYIQSFGR